MIVLQDVTGPNRPLADPWDAASQLSHFGHSRILQHSGGLIVGKNACLAHRGVRLPLN
jgi:hypothetical protein